MEVFQAIMEQIVNGTSQIRGIMLESNLYFGSQQISALSDLKYGVSITDSCLDLKRTKELIYSAAVLLEQKYRSQPVFI